MVLFVFLLALNSDRCKCKATKICSKDRRLRECLAVKCTENLAGWRYGFIFRFQIPSHDRHCRRERKKNAKSVLPGNLLVHVLTRQLSLTMQVQVRA